MSPVDPGDLCRPRRPREWSRGGPVAASLAASLAALATFAALAVLLAAFAAFLAALAAFGGLA